MDYKRIILGSGLLVTLYLLLLAWQEDYGKQNRTSTSETELRKNRIEDVPSPSAISQTPTFETSIGTSNYIPVLAEELISDQKDTLVAEYDRFVTVETDVLHVIIDKIGGDIIKVSLPQYPESIDMPEQPFILLDPINTYSAQTGLIGPYGTDSALSRPHFRTQSNNYEMDELDALSVVLEFDQESGSKILKTFKFSKESYLVEITYDVENYTDEDWKGALYGQIKRDSRAPQNSGGNAMMMRPFVGGATRTEKEPYKKLKFDDIEESTFSTKHQGGYMALVQHYFVSAFIPDATFEHNYQARKLPNQDIYIFGFTSPLWVIPAGTADTQSLAFYAGPKDQYRLKELAGGLDLTVDYGFLWWLAQPLFWLLTKIQENISSNWGGAIILLTLCIKGALYPLSAAAYRSTAKMRKLQPELLRLREQFGDDRQKMSQGMMDLYKKAGTNPLGGCLPVLLQMPVFIALYWVLLESVELRQAPFILWIDDLAAMDPYFVLPILMGVSMYFVTAMQPEPPDPMQAKIFKWMPIVFTFLFIWFPAGLVLYWLVNNVVSLLQQWYVTRQVESGK